LTGRDLDKNNSVSTRETILRVSARLFSEKGYDKVTIREIARAAGINSASIYYHFPSKANILTSLYGLYSEERIKESPNVDELLMMIETCPPHMVLLKTEFHFNEDIRDLLDQILVTASREICSNAESENFIRENIFSNIDNILRPIIQRMMDLKKIEPFALDTFLEVLSYYCYSAAVLNNSVFKHGVSEYRDCMSFLFSMIKPSG
jgi:AcrR family transcriptional regulator